MAIDRKSLELHRLGRRFLGGCCLFLQGKRLGIATELKVSVRVLDGLLTLIDQLMDILLHSLGE